LRILRVLYIYIAEHEGYEDRIKRLGGRKEGYWEIDVVPEKVENLEKDTLRYLKMQHYKDIVIWKH